ncbi:hypothetical protein [Ktedonobacter robiniae]|uniref:Cytochrome C biogenesis protein transmembrane domain-containing protein n=1 Tax=Ktedonobacter robiniae TaxID=2778365 RepID=A0ABQ3V4A9_9CHLR|nr:hypothetical protein [Ktedonobacter robiniae]GHO60004.1 hypothetical protein KSB_84790 [Ktedonobacter robiniae]
MSRHISRENDMVWPEDALPLETASETRSLPVWIIVGFAVIVGLVLAMIWVPAVADDVIGENIANTIVGSTAKTVTLNDTLFGIVFAIAAGLGTTFTACNCAVFSCLAPLAKEEGQKRIGIGSLLLYMCAGVVAVTAIYGGLGAIMGGQMPSLSTAVVHLPMGDYPLRLLQSTIAFVGLGVVLVIWGANSLRLRPNALSRLAQRHAWLTPLGLGIIIGFFTVGRPFPLFHKLFSYSAGTGNLALSAALVALQGLGNIAVMAVIFVLLTRGTGGRVTQWLQANPWRARMLTAISMFGAGTFLIFYWGVRVPSAFGIGWFPHL